jgi:uncharacterized LabA/DUF88 family protein
MKEEIVYVFIDAQNLHLGVKTQGWEIDYQRFYIYLNDKYKIKRVFLFIGYLEKYKPLYKKLKSYGYDLIYKTTTIHNGEVKGNVDAELVLYASAKEFLNYDKAVIISGDGDFHCLIEYLLEYNKLLRIMIPNRKGYSYLLNDFYQYLLFIDEIKKKIE